MRINPKYRAKIIKSRKDLKNSKSNSKRGKKIEKKREKGEKKGKIEHLAVEVPRRRELS